METNPKNILLPVLLILLLFSFGFFVTGAAGDALFAATTWGLTNNSNLTGTINLTLIVSNHAENVTFYYKATNGSWVKIATVNNNSATDTAFEYSWDSSAVNVNYTIINATADNRTSEPGIGDGVIKEASNITLTIDNTAPVVSLITPGNNMVNGTNTTIDFNWTVSDNIDLSLNCTLGLNSTTANVSRYVSNGTNNFNFTIIGISEGPHIWNVTCYDDAGKVHGATRTLIIDQTAPTAYVNMTADFITGKVRTIEYGDPVTFNCSGADLLDDSPNVTLRVKAPGSSGYVTVQGPQDEDIKSYKYTSTNSLGVYYINCSVEDWGNKHFGALTDFTVVSKQQERQPPPETKTHAKQTINKGNTEELGTLTSDRAIGRLMAEKSTAKLIIKEKEHSIIVESINSEANKVALTITSDPIKLEISVGETKEIDLDGDSINDLLITLYGIINKKADLEFKTTSETKKEEKPEEPEEPKTPEQETKSKSWIWILVTAVIIIAVVIYFVVIKKKNSKPRYYTN